MHVVVQCTSTGESTWIIQSISVATPSICVCDYFTRWPAADCDIHGGRGWYTREHIMENIEGGVYNNKRAFINQRSYLLSRTRERHLLMKFDWECNQLFLACSPALRVLKTRRTTRNARFSVETFECMCCVSPVSFIVYFFASVPLEQLREFPLQSASTSLRNALHSWHEWLVYNWYHIETWHAGVCRNNGSALHCIETV